MAHELVDPRGRPFPKTPPTKRTAEASTTGYREQIYPAVTRGMTPESLACILDAAAAGDISEFLSMAEEMEEKDLHFYSLLSTRKIAIKGAPRSLEPFDESARAKEIAELCEKHVINKPAFSGLIFDLSDALSKGFAVVQPVWDTHTRPWTYKEYYYTDPRWFKTDSEDISKFLLCTDRAPDGEEIPAGKFVFHLPKIKSGLAIRGGLARMAAITYMLKSYTMKDWLAFMEVFGMPTRIGKYDPNTATDREKQTLLNALRGLGHDAAAMIPDGMEIELLDAKRASGGDSLFGGLADYLDKQVSKGILGQTMTSDDGASLAQAKVHQMVRQDILESDAEQMEATLNESIIRPWVVYNFGAAAPVPTLKIQTEPPEDLKLFTEAFKPWVEKGVTVEAHIVRDKFGIPEPAEGAEDVIGETQDVDESPEDDQPVPPGNGGEVATNAALPPSLQRAEDRPAEMATQWERVLGPHRDLLNEIAANSTSYDDFLRRLKGAEKDFDSNMFVRMLALEMSKVRGEANAS